MCCSGQRADQKLRCNGQFTDRRTYDAYLITAKPQVIDIFCAPLQGVKKYLLDLLRYLMLPVYVSDISSNGLWYVL